MQDFWLLHLIVQFPVMYLFIYFHFMHTYANMFTSFFKTYTPWFIVALTLWSVIMLRIWYMATWNLLGTD